MLDAGGDRPALPQRPWRRWLWCAGAGGMHPGVHVHARSCSAARALQPMPQTHRVVARPRAARDFRVLHGEKPRRRGQTAVARSVAGTVALSLGQRPSLAHIRAPPSRLSAAWPLQQTTAQPLPPLRAKPSAYRAERGSATAPPPHNAARVRFSGRCGRCSRSRGDRLRKSKEGKEAPRGSPAAASELLRREVSVGGDPALGAKRAGQGDCRSSSALMRRTSVFAVAASKCR